MPGGVGAVAAALAAGWLLYRRRRAAEERERIAGIAESVLPGATRGEDTDGTAVVRVVERGVVVTLRAGAPRSGDPPWPEGLGASARFVTGAGPAFRAEGAELDAHLRVGSQTTPLRALYRHTIPVVGEHVEAGPLIQRVLAEREPTGPLPAPLLRSDGHEVSAWLATMPDAVEISVVLSGLVALVAGLARWRDDVLDGYATATEAVVSVEPTSRPPLRATLRTESRLGPILLEALYERDGTGLVAPLTFAIRASGPTHLALPTERVPLERAHPSAARHLSPELMFRAGRAHVRGERGRVLLEWALPPSTLEMAAAVEILRALAPPAVSRGPFR